MLKYFLLSVLFICSQKVKAQKSRTDFEISRYKHTITFLDHKLSFQLQGADQLLSKVDKNKEYHWYSNNQIKTTQGGFSGRLLHGLYNDFYINHHLKEQGQFKLGLKVGEWKKWNEDGKILEYSNYVDGILRGTFSRYSPTGALAESGFYKKGKIHGEFKRYLRADSIIIIKYKNGVVQQQTQSWIKKQLNKSTKFLSSKN